MFRLRQITLKIESHTKQLWNSYTLKHFQRHKTYRIVASAVVERIPVVLKDLEPWDQEYTDYVLAKKNKMVELQKQEAWKRFEAEMLMREKMGKPKKQTKDKRAERGKGGGKESGGSPEKEEKVDWRSLKNDQEVWTDLIPNEPEPKKENYPLITEADKTNNRKSLYRALTSRLFLIVKKDRKEHAWQFPQGGYEKVDGVHLRNTAVRELREECGSELKVWWTGNAPFTHWEYDLNSTYQKKYNSDATKVFFYRSTYLAGEVKLNPNELIDYAWVTRDELKEYIDNNLYQRLIQILAD
jgi:large subunit ribosomal protein L46